MLILKGKAFLLMCKRYCKGADSGSQWQQRLRSCKEILLSARQLYRKRTPKWFSNPEPKVSEPQEDTTRGRQGRSRQVLGLLPLTMFSSPLR